MVIVSLFDPNLKRIIDSYFYEKELVLSGEINLSRLLRIIGEDLGYDLEKICRSKPCLILLNREVISERNVSIKNNDRIEIFIQRKI